MTDREAIRRLAEIVNDVIRAIRPEACFPHMKQKENLQEVRDLIEALADPATATDEYQQGYKQGIADESVYGMPAAPTVTPREEYQRSIGRSLVENLEGE